MNTRRARHALSSSEICPLDSSAQWFALTSVGSIFLVGKQTIDGASRP
jgi:hypothetical protein